MILLKINDHKAEFYNNEKEYKEISIIKKEDIFFLLEYIYKNDDYTFDEPQKEGDKQILSPSDKIIYDRLYKKFKEVSDKKEEVIELVKAEYKEAYEKYMPKPTNTES